MSKIELLKVFLNQRLSAAAEEIFGAVEQTIADYHEECSRTKEENDRLLKLLDDVLKPEIKLHRTDLQHLTASGKKIPAENELYEKWKPLSLGQEDPELTQIKKEKVELGASQVKEELHWLEQDLSPATVERDCHQNSSLFTHLASTSTEQINTEFDEDEYLNTDSSSPQTGSSRSSTSTPCRQRPADNNWHYNFMIPWHRMSPEVNRKLENKERPTAKERRALIRLIADEVITTCPTPGKKHLSEIARKMVLTYPKSFKDVIEDQVIGSGYDSLTKQLQTRVDNLKRDNTLSRRRKSSISVRETDEVPPKKVHMNSYGCINWQPVQLPANETTETQKAQQEKMKKMHKDRSNDTRRIEKMMSATFYSQRKDISRGMDTSDLCKEWPYLFETSGIKTHFKELTGIDPNYEFEQAIGGKCERLVSYLKFLPTEKRSEIPKILYEIEAAKEKLPGAKLQGLVLLLLKYFNEEDKFFFVVEKTCLPSEVDCAKLPCTPCVVVCGSPPLTAEHFMVAVDQTIVNGTISNFTDALLMMFALYYCLNINYPVEMAATLEFLQRCFFTINPDKGSKVEKNASRKPHVVSPKVLSLITNIAGYEWIQ
ncbi:uncharacterized protein LOC105030828 isoform X2 [Esox lucius]|uniref:Uncharacterized protein n=2 Tax=Esox lucius TaxID=8010 RepID=A0A6Q2ZML6_ESOLU|nr:uncharacterized protein LOC105030828 isoform X2 [Esox lucius]XP_019909205.3 uncharacterized protein LOC105030828 isoform X2 [Esox lucius]XP_034152707.1 uncharacterized protein LOC105030828 isoform X2 [Esox lucius]